MFWEKDSEMSIVYFVLGGGWYNKLSVVLFCGGKMIDLGPLLYSNYALRIHLRACFCPTVL